MSDDYTPTTIDVKTTWRVVQAGRPEAHAEFERWLASVKAEARAAALRGAADAFDVLDTEALHDEDAHTAATGIMDDPSGWLRALANQQETPDE